MEQKFTTIYDLRVSYETLTLTVDKENVATAPSNAARDVVGEHLNYAVSCLTDAETMDLQDRSERAEARTKLIRALTSNGIAVIMLYARSLDLREQPEDSMLHLLVQRLVNMGATIRLQIELLNP